MLQLMSPHILSESFTSGVLPMTDRTESTGGGQWEREAGGPVDCDVIFSMSDRVDNSIAAKSLAFLTREYY